MEKFEFEKSKNFITADVLEYRPDSVMIKIIIKRPTGDISLVSFDSGQALAKKTFPFDSFVQIIDGKAEVVIDDQSNLLETGQSIIIPAHSYNTIKANERFKMLYTMIKSGYEDVIL